MELTQEDLVQALGNLTIPQLTSLTKQLETTWGVQAAPQAIQISPTTPEVKKEIQTEFTVVLASVPADKKIPIIKALRDILSVSLLDAKSLVEAAPKPIKENVSQEEAESVKARLTEAGGVCEIK